jgi:signal transduction histidine kinase
VAPGLKARGDATLLRVVLENLLGNAWKYTSRTKQPRIEFGATTLANGASEYFVRDNGVGFDQAQAHRLFRPFQRLHQAQEFPGNGLGLSSARLIIEGHGGRIRAEGHPGQGATFSFTLGKMDEKLAAANVGA